MTAIQRFIVLMACLLTICPGCGREMKTVPKPGQELPPGVNMRLSGNVNFAEWDGTRKIWAMTSEKATYSTGENLLDLSGVSIEYYKDDVPVYRANSKHGRYFSDTRAMELRGEVEVTGGDEYRLTTSRLRYSFEEKIASNDSPLKLVGEGFEMSGVGMVADIEKETLEVKRGVSLLANPASIRESQGKGK